MAHYSVSQYTFVVALPKGKLTMRVICPTCGHVHANIAQGGESFCHGCGQELYVRGSQLLTEVVPPGWFREIADDEVIEEAQLRDRPPQGEPD